MSGLRTVASENDGKPQLSDVFKHFHYYSQLLDSKNDKYERIYKTSRDITVKSKRIIFSLQRIPGLDEEEKVKLLSTAKKDLCSVEQTLFKQIAMELRAEEPYQFINAYTDGLQEYIEAVTFCHYLQFSKLISHKEIQDKLIFSNDHDDIDESIPLNVMVPHKEFMLGFADFTGEVMRYCIKSVSTGDYDTCQQICDMLRAVNVGFVSIGAIPIRELSFKLNVFRSSLQKVEDVCYSLQLRKSELPPNMLNDMFSSWGNEEIPGQVLKESL